MIKIHVPGVESFDDETEKFVEVGGYDLEFEHSLVSLSKWESKYEKAFISKDNKTSEEIFDYAEMMCTTPNPPPDFIHNMTDENFKELVAYIDSKQTATVVRNMSGQRASSEVTTSELIYYWMVSLQIPFECQHWHLNRLITLIKVCSAKNTPPKKMSHNEIAARNRELNAQRKAQYKTTG